MMSEETFTGFMRRHSQYLRTFKANHLEMTDLSDSWQHVIETIAPVMTLDNVQLKGLHDRALNQSAVGWGPGYEATARHDAYYASVSSYLELGGRGEYPVWDEIDEPSHDSR